MNSAAKSTVDEMLCRAQQGGSAALGQLLEYYRGYLKVLARLQIADRLRVKEDASDIVQEAFLDAHRAFSGFSGDSEPEFLQWLRKILASRLAKLVRRYRDTQRRDVRLERRLDHDLEQSSCALHRALVDRADSPSRRVARREQAVILANAIDQLPDHYREIILLHHIQGCTHAEVARRTGRTVASVKKIWVRALAQLRRSLGEQP